MLQLKIFITSLVLVLLSACSGGTGGTGAGGTTSSVSSGAVTKLGSVFVNGVEFETINASITRDGVTVSEATVLSMPAEVIGTISGDSGTAVSVTASTAVKGVVDSVTNETSMVVMGQTIRLDDGALVSTNPNDAFTDLIAGDLVEIAGMPKTGGVIIATLVEEKSSLLEYKVKGYVKSGTVNTGAKTFEIGGLIINYNSADMSDVPGGPADDLLLEVKASTAPVAGVLTATKIEIEGLSIDTADKVEVEGYIRDLTGSNPDYTFYINGQEVQTDSSTVFEGATATFIAENIKVEAEGVLVSEVIQADKVSLKDSVRMEGDIVSLSGNSFSLEGMTGITVTVNAATEINSTSDLFTDFSNGTHVRLRGVPATATTVTVTRLDERNPGDPDAYLRGPVSGIASTVITVLGQDIDVVGLSFQDENDVGITQSAFLAAIQVGTPVKIQGTLSGAVITWDSAELED